MTITTPKLTFEEYLKYDDGIGVLFHTPISNNIVTQFWVLDFRLTSAMKSPALSINFKFRSERLVN